MSDQESGPAEPALRVIRGDPTAEELAALLTVLAAAAGAGAEPADPEPTASGWATYWRTHARSVQPGRDAWRNSLR